MNLEIDLAIKNWSVNGLGNQKWSRGCIKFSKMAWQLARQSSMNLEMDYVIEKCVWKWIRLSNMGLEID
jgi:hypothetical protein